MVSCILADLTDTFTRSIPQVGDHLTPRTPGSPAVPLRQRIRGGDPRPPTEDVDVQAASFIQTVGAVHADAGTLARRRTGPATVSLSRRDLGLDVGRDPAHRVVSGGEHRHEFGDRVHAQVGTGELGDVGGVFVSICSAGEISVRSGRRSRVRPAPRPSRTSCTMARATMSRGARSLMVGRTAP